MVQKKADFMTNDYPASKTNTETANNQKPEIRFSYSLELSARIKKLEKTKGIKEKPLWIMAINDLLEKNNL